MRRGAGLVVDADRVDESDDDRAAALSVRDRFGRRGATGAGRALSPVRRRNCQPYRAVPGEPRGTRRRRRCPASRMALVALVSHER